MVSNPPDWINVQFGISKASIDSNGDCTCGAQDCYTVSLKTYHTHDIMLKNIKKLYFMFSD